MGIRFDASHTCGKVTMTKSYGYPTSLCITDLQGSFRYIFLFVHTRQDTNVGNHSHVHDTYTPQANTYKLRMTQQLMMVLTLNCKHYKIYYLLYNNENTWQTIQRPKVDVHLQTICKRCPHTFKLFCFVVDLIYMFLYYHVEVIQIYYHFNFLTVIYVRFCKQYNKI